MKTETPPEVLRQALHEALYREGQLNHDLKDLRTQLVKAQQECDCWKMQAEQKWGMRRELEELLQVGDTECEEQFAKGLAALRNLIQERDEAREALFGMNWVSVERELPPMDVPVWLYLPDIRLPVIGCRSDGGEGWLWCRCYDDFWFDGAWKTSTADADDSRPSHWMPLPLPPNARSRPPSPPPLNPLKTEH